MTDSSKSAYYFITGHSGCGLKHIAQMCAAVNIDIQHNKTGLFGIASWRSSPNRVCTRIHIVENPFTAIPYIAEHQEYNATARTDFLRQHTSTNLALYSKTNAAAHSFLAMNAFIKNSPVSVTINYENMTPLADLFDHSEYARPQFNHKRAPADPLSFKWRELPPNVMSLLDEYCIKYNYPKLTVQITNNTVPRSVPTTIQVQGPRMREHAISQTFMGAAHEGPAEKSQDAQIRPRINHQVVLTQNLVEPTRRKKFESGY